jgi:hypothetical protein
VIASERTPVARRKMDRHNEESGDCAGEVEGPTLERSGGGGQRQRNGHQASNREGIHLGFCAGAGLLE